MPIKKVKDEKVKKEEIKETKIEKQNVKQDKEGLPRELLENPNASPIFDIFFYRELFMALRQKLDTLYDKKDRSEKDLEAYDDAVYSITNNAFTEAAAQDFLSYCFKKGKYDFCLMNYEKHMKWELLSAANGNAFAISKLQIFLTNMVEDILTLNNHSYMIDFLGLTVENYFIFIGKLICEEMVKILNISPETLIKMPEAYQEQDEENTRLFDNTKMDAAKKVKEQLKDSINKLVEFVKKEEELEKEYNRAQKEKLKKQNEETKVEQKEEEIKENEKTDSKKSSQKPKIKKFRY